MFFLCSCLFLNFFNFHLLSFLNNYLSSHTAMISTAEFCALNPVLARSFSKNYMNSSSTRYYINFKSHFSNVETVNNIFAF